MPQLPALSLQVTCQCPAIRFPSVSVFSNTSLQVTTSTLSGSSAHNSSLWQWGQLCYPKAGGSLFLRAGQGLLPRCVRAVAPLSVSPFSWAKGQTRQLPLFCNQLWVDPYRKQGCTIKLKERVRKKPTNQPNKQTGHAHPLSGIQLVDRTNKRCIFRKPWHLSSVGLGSFPCMCTVPQIPQGEKAKNG